MNEKIKVDYLKPFGAGLLHGQLPEDILDGFLKLSKEVIKKKTTRWNPALVGAIEDEWKIPDLLYKDFKIDDFLLQAFKTYVRVYLNDIAKFSKFNMENEIDHKPEFDVKVKRGDGWINYTKEHEYNPPHFHSNCSLSSIFYLNNEEDYKEGRLGHTDGKYSVKHNDEDGHTLFIDGSKSNGAILTDRTDDKDTFQGVVHPIIDRTHFTVKPHRGRFFIFPAHLLHCVNPFVGKKGRRITASINCGFTAKLVSGPDSIGLQ